MTTADQYNEPSVHIELNKWDIMGFQRVLQVKRFLSDNIHTGMASGVHAYACEC